jgi:preprotein translocase subunit SecD
MFQRIITLTLALSLSAVALATPAISVFASEPLLDSSEIRRAQMIEIPGQVAMLDIEMTEAGAAKLKRHTAAHLNEKMTVVIEGAPTLSPTIRSPLKGRSFRVSFATTKEARAFAERLAGAKR